MSNCDTGPKGLERLYRLLLLLYPPGFRAAFSSEMIQIFLDTYRDAAASRECGGRVLFWYGTFEDFALSLVEEWGRALVQPGEAGRLVREAADWLAVPLLVIGSLLAAVLLCGTVVLRS
jgi:hypothetical protein